MTIIPEDVNVNEGGGSAPVDAYTKTEVDTLLSLKANLADNSFFGVNSFTDTVFLNGQLVVNYDSIINCNGTMSISGGTLSGENANVFFQSSSLNIQEGEIVLTNNDGNSVNIHSYGISIPQPPAGPSNVTNKEYVDNQIAAVESEVASNTTKTTTLRNDLDDLGDQVAVIQGTVNTLTTKDRWILNGKPENLTLTTSLQKVVMPATTRFPTTQPESMEMTEDGTGILFKKAGLVHFRRRVSLGGSNTENLFYEMRVNDTQLEPLQTQAVSISKDTMSYTIDFYWQVTAQQTLSIWANCLENTCALNYKGVTTIIEYI